MQTYDCNLGQALLFKMATKKTDHSPDYIGRIGLPGGDHMLMAWTKKDKNGKKYFQLTVGGMAKPYAPDNNSTDDDDDGSED